MNWPEEHQWQEATARFAYKMQLQECLNTRHMVWEPCFLDESAAMRVEHSQASIVFASMVCCAENPAHRIANNTYLAEMLLQSAALGKKTIVQHVWGFALQTSGLTWQPVPAGQFVYGSWC